MICEVQRLYLFGKKCSKPLEAVPGELCLFIWGDGLNRQKRTRAELAGQNGDLAIPLMLDALVVKITAEGIVVKGTEVVPRNSSSKANVEYYPQTWWCKVIPGKLMPGAKIDQPAVPAWRTALQHHA